MTQPVPKNGSAVVTKPLKVQVIADEEISSDDSSEIEEPQDSI